MGRWTGYWQRGAVGIFAWVFMLTCTPRVTTAQTAPRIAVSGSFQTLTYSGPSNDGTQTFTSNFGLFTQTTTITRTGYGSPTYSVKGWQVDGAGRVASHVAVVGDVAGNRDTSLNAFGFSS